MKACYSIFTATLLLSTCAKAMEEFDIEDANVVAIQRQRTDLKNQRARSSNVLEQLELSTQIKLLKRLDKLSNEPHNLTPEDLSMFKQSIVLAYKEAQAQLFQIAQNQGAHHANPFLAEEKEENIEIPEITTNEYFDAPYNEEENIFNALGRKWEVVGSTSGNNGCNFDAMCQDFDLKNYNDIFTPVFKELKRIPTAAENDLSQEKDDRENPLLLLTRKDSKKYGGRRAMCYYLLSKTVAYRQGENLAAIKKIDAPIFLVLQEDPIHALPEDVKEKKEHGALRFLDTPLLELQDAYGLMAKDLLPQAPDDPRTMDERYMGRSQLLASFYPKVPMIHSHQHEIQKTPFWAAVECDQIMEPFKYFFTRWLPDTKPIYSFTVQLLSNDPKRVQENVNATFRPHYLVFPDAPYRYAGQEYKGDVSWTVVPGALGNITPQKGSFSECGLLGNAIRTYGLHGNRLSLSNDDMNLNGFTILHGYNEEAQPMTCNPSVDMYSLTLFHGIAHIGYHWILSPGFSSIYSNGKHDLVEPFCQALENAGTMRELIVELEKNPNFEPSLVNELKKFINYK